MTAAASFLQRLVDLLDTAGVPYMVAGSFASTYHGVPRTTHDIDLVVEPSFSSLKRLLALLPEDAYYVSQDAARDALRRRGQFNVIDLESGWKVDLIVRKEREFSRTEFERRARGQVQGVEMFVASAEDTILTKLEWAKASESERQLRDVAGVIAVAGDHLDGEYVDRWVERLGLQRQWSEALAMAEDSS
jgi:hypothetical protein